MMVYGLFITLKGDSLDFVVRSDGRGYYAYLPALFIYHDGSFERSAAAEKGYYEHAIDQLYLFKDKTGNTYNKYFPGIAVLQAPFFGIACAVSWITGYPVDGYSAVFRLFFFLGSLFYLFCGLILFTRCLEKLFPGERSISWIVPLLYFASPLFFYGLITPSFTHLYSFFLFGCFAWQVLKMKEGITGRSIFLTGIVLGLIALLRPTNLTVVLMVPFLLGNAEETVWFFRRLFAQRCRKLALGISGFLAMLCLVFLSWKWQTGHWTVWSYNGEGFDFLHPHLLATLFSFRTGLFLHAPVMWLVLAGWILLWRRQRFQAIFWGIYFTVNCWIMASWWCWDYESPFGNRPMTEHFFFLFLPLVFLLTRKGTLTLIGTATFALVGIIRYYEIRTGFMGDQRFTRANYLPSLAFWKKENENRWNFTRSCVPFGKLIDEKWLLNDPDARQVNATDEFVYGAEAAFPRPRTHERFSYRVELEKEITGSTIDGVMLVIDAYSKDNAKRYYKTTDLFNDRFEGQGKWSENLIFEGHIHDYLQEYDFVKIYIWNQGKKTFRLRNVKILLEEYKA